MREETASPPGALDSLDALSGDDCCADLSSACTASKRGDAEGASAGGAGALDGGIAAPPAGLSAAPVLLKPSAEGRAACTMGDGEAGGWYWWKDAAGAGGGGGIGGGGDGGGAGGGG
mmetsp:Transcript_16579/g.52892  ORF Transcript_16579/g.52892 Transcript_16579/m.52892 type:complete len:117 (-) Transcript_16579:370-720(-)